MRITVRVKPGSSKGPLVEVAEPGGEITVFLRERAVDGAANDGLIATLANHFGVAKSKVKLVSGFTARIKRIEIED